MKRYFDDAEERVTLVVETDKPHGAYTVEQLNVKYDAKLREIDKKEYNELNKEYVG